MLEGEPKPSAACRREQAAAITRWPFSDLVLYILYTVFTIHVFMNTLYCIHEYTVNGRASTCANLDLYLSSLDGLK